MLFKLNGTNPWTYVIPKSTTGQGIQFIPGVNKFEDSDWKDARKHPQIAKMLSEKKLEILVEKDAKQEDAALKNASVELAELTAKEAMSIVKQCNNVPLLEKWEETEERSTVLNVVAKQLENIKG
jgi:hypothetical protein